MKKITPELLERYYSNSCTAEERNEVETWLNSQDPQTPNEDQLLSKTWEALSSEIPTTETKPYFYRSTFAQLGGIAAVLALLLFGAFYGYRNFYNPTIEGSAMLSSNLTAIDAERGEKRTVQLPDGSTVIINAESELQIPKVFEKDSRVVYLTGHAHFDIQRDENRPFIIYTSTSKTQVLGTSFDVVAYKDSKTTKVVVTSGKVRFSELENEDNSVDLTVDKQGVLSPNTPIQVNEVVGTYRTAWKDNILVFDNQAFKDIVTVLERWYAIDITVNDKELLERQFTFTYENPSVEELFERMGFVAQFEYAIEGRNITIY
ncbi:MAG: FecR domain-containing protein [Bacteroidota bacterium]